MGILNFNNKVLNMNEMSDFVNIASSLCFTSEGEYIPALKRFALYYAILMYYTDYNPQEKNVDEVYQYMYTIQEEPGGRITNPIYAEINQYVYTNNQIIDLLAATEATIERKLKPYSIVETISKMIEKGELNTVIEFVGDIINNYANIEMNDKSLSENANEMSSE